MAMRQYDFSFEAMACVNELSLYASNKRQATAVAKKAIDAINKLESRYSRYLPDSLLTRINESAGDTRGVAVDEETAALLNYSQTCFEQSDGMFDITSGVLRRIWNFRENKLPTDSEVADTLQLIGWDKGIWDESRIVLPPTGMEHSCHRSAPGWQSLENRYSESR